MGGNPPRRGLFPSPFGVRFLKYNQEQGVAKIHFMFPSPFGVRFLKSDREREIARRERGSFRPLSGFAF